MFPHLRELQAAHSDRGLTILAVTRYAPVPVDADADAARAQERELVQTVISDRGLDFRVAIAPDGTLQQQYGAAGVPTLVLIDRQGRVQLIASGGDDAALDLAIERCLEAPSQ